MHIAHVRIYKNLKKYFIFDTPGPVLKQVPIAVTRELPPFFRPLTLDIQFTRII